MGLAKRYCVEYVDGTIECFRGDGGFWYTQVCCVRACVSYGFRPDSIPNRLQLLSLRSQDPADEAILALHGTARFFIAPLVPKDTHDVFRGAENCPQIPRNAQLVGRKCKTLFRNGKEAEPAGVMSIGSLHT